MIYTTEQLAKLRAETVAALLDYYERPVQAPAGTEVPDTGSYARRRTQQSRDARTMVTRALEAGISARLLAAETHLPGLLIINMIDDNQQRADAYTAELHHLQREMDAVRRARARDARDRFAGGEVWKNKLAESFGVSRPTLNAWLDSADE